MRSLATVPWETLKVNDGVISAKETPGVITELYINQVGIKEKDPDNRMVVITWENGDKSFYPHNLLDKVQYIGQ